MISGQERCIPLRELSGWRRGFHFTLDHVATFNIADLAADVQHLTEDEPVLPTLPADSDLVIFGRGVEKKGVGHC